MKKTFSIILMLLFALVLTLQICKAQTPGTCQLTAAVDCNMNLTATAPVSNPAWVCQLTQGGSVLYNIPVQPDGITFIFPVSFFLTPGLDYAVSYSDGYNYGCGFSTYFIAAPGKVTTGCTGGFNQLCTVTQNPCPVSPLAPPAGDPVKPGKGNGRGK